MPGMKALVTGVNGFVGKHLVRALRDRGCEVLGAGREPLADDIKPLLAGFTLCELTDAQAVQKLPLSDIDVVINLAGLANVVDSFRRPELYKKVNVDVLSVIAEGLLRTNPSARVVAVSTGAVYDSFQPMPLTEASQLVENSSPYAVSKLLMEAAARDLRKRGLDCVVVRPFNHIGPGQASGFLVPDLYRKITAARQNGGPVMVGNLQARRDFTDVRDIVRAYADLAVASSLQFDTYNVCSGTSRSAQEILDILLAQLSPDQPLRIEVDRNLLRPNDPPDLRGSYDRLHQQTGWQPTIPLKKTVRDFIAAT